MIDDLTSLETRPPAVKKIRRGLVLLAVSLVVAIFVFFSLAQVSKKQGAVKKGRESAVVETPTERVGTESFVKLPRSYADLKTQKAKEPAPVVKVEPQPQVIVREPYPRVRVSRAVREKTEAEQEKEKALKSGLFFKTSNPQSSNIRNVAAPVTNPGANFENPELGGLTFPPQIAPVDTSERRINQRNKKGFLDEAAPRDSAIYLERQLQQPASPYQIMAGTVIPAVLISGINSDLPGPILAQVRENVFDNVSGKYLLIPQGTRLFGRYDNMVSWGQERVLLVWSRLIFPDGSSILLENMPGADLSGYAGLKDSVNNHYFKLATAVLLSTFLNVGARVAAGNTDDFQPTVEQQLAAEAGAGVNQAGQQIVGRQLTVPPTIEVRPGWPFNVMVNKDIILKPYEE
jgi:type IV secretion system protein VirB10